MKKTLLIALGLAMSTAAVYAQPATTAKSFRMYNDPLSSVTITASAAPGTGTFTWPQPAAGVFKSTAGGIMSIGSVALGTDVSGLLPVGNGGTGLGAVPANHLLVGTGGSALATLAPVANSMLVTNGAGVPSWSTFPPAIPFNQISSGTNLTATMTVGTGATMGWTGTGTISANIFNAAAGTNAVDLNTVEVAGTLPVGNGGTGTTTNDLNEILLGNGSSPIQSLNNPVGARILTHPGGAAVAPAWSTSIPAGVTVGFDQITSGTNVAATMTVGTGATMTFSGSGVVNANQFNGTGSTTNAVDLATAEVAGTLPLARGGTNQTGAAVAGAVIYSDANSYEYSAVGTAGQFLQSQGAAAPTWATGSIALAKGFQAGNGAAFSYTVAPGVDLTAASQIMITFKNAGPGGLQTTYAIVEIDVVGDDFTVEFANILSASEGFSWIVF